MSNDKMTTEQARERDIARMEAEMVHAETEYFKHRPQLFRTIEKDRIFEAGFKAAWSIRQALSAPSVPDELRSVVADIRAHCNPPNPETCDEVSASYALYWADRIEALITADPAPADDMETQLAAKDWVIGNMQLKDSEQEAEIADLRAEVEALKEREDAMCDLHYARGLAAGQNFVESGDYDGLNNAISRRMTPAVAALEAARLREGGE